jgi:hypothetical protein
LSFINKIQQRLNSITLKSVKKNTLKNINYNLRYTKSGKSISLLRELKINKIGVVIGAGPSLRKEDQSIYLKKNRNKFYIIACDGALNYLLSSKIIPDLVVTLDPHPSRIVRWFGDTKLNMKKLKLDDYFEKQDLDTKLNGLESNKKLVKLFDKYSDKIKVAICTSSSKAVVERLKKCGTKMFWWNPFLDEIKKKESLSKKIYNLNKLPLVNTGGNVGSAAWMIADQVYNFKKIVLIGMDFSYYLETPLASTQYYKVLDKITKSSNEKKKFYKKIYNPHTKGFFYTDYIYLWYRENFLEMISNTTSTTMNCTQAGILFGKKIKWTSLSMLCKNF